MKTKLALVTGSFDPITNGHVDIVRRAAAMFDRVIVLVANNEEKTYMFSAEQRRDIAEAAVSDIPNASVEYFAGYVADFAKEHAADAFVRGIRDGNDVEYEQYMANKNFELCSVDTVMLFAKPEYHEISSTAVRKSLSDGGDAEGMMPHKALEKAKEFLK